MTSSRHCRTVVDRTILPLFLASRLAQPLRVCAARLFCSTRMSVFRRVGAGSAQALHALAAAGIIFSSLWSYSRRTRIAPTSQFIAVTWHSHRTHILTHRTLVALTWHSHGTRIALTSSLAVLTSRDPSHPHRNRSRPYAAGWGNPARLFFALDTEQAFVV